MAAREARRPLRVVRHFARNSVGVPFIYRRVRVRLCTAGQVTSIKHWFRYDLWAPRVFLRGEPLRKRTCVAKNVKVLKNNGIWRLNLSKKLGLEISRRGVQFLAPESLCSPSYEGLKVHVSQNTILYIIVELWINYEL